MLYIQPPFCASWFFVRRSGGTINILKRQFCNLDINISQFWQAWFVINFWINQPCCLPFCKSSSQSTHNRWVLCLCLYLSLCVSLSSPLSSPRHQDIIINLGGLSISLYRPSHFLQVWLPVDSLPSYPVLVFVCVFVIVIVIVITWASGLSISLCGP